MKVKNISGNKMEVSGHRLCNNHILELMEGENVDELIKAGMLIRVNDDVPATPEEKKEEKKEEVAFEEKEESKFKCDKEGCVITDPHEHGKVEPKVSTNEEGTATTVPEPKEPKND